MNTPPAASPTRSFRSYLTVILLLIWLGLIGGLAYNRQGLQDWWRLRNYQAPAAVAQLASDDTMTPSARRVLYVNQPQLQPKASFTDCNLGIEQAAILGCYHSNQAGIFVLAVSDDRLNGIEQVTAAHEMLHGAYDRLNSHQKQAINTQLQQFYDHDLHDATIRAQIVAYQKSEPNDVVNEMHSIFATEVDTLPASLEQYYRQYFTNRSTIAHYYDLYQAAFTSRLNTVKADDAQLDALKSQIDSLESSLRSQLAALKAQQANLTSLRANGDIAAYNAAVPSYNQSVRSYNQAVDTLHARIASYNQLVVARNAVALESQQLTQEISTQASTISR